MNGDFMRKWYIGKLNGHWLVMPPVTQDPAWHLRATLFPTGAQALAAFARGGRP